MLDDSFSVSLTGTVLFFVVVWWDKFQYVSFFLFLSQFFLVLSCFVYFFFQEGNRSSVKIFSTKVIVLSYVLFLIFVLWLSLFLGFYKTFLSSKYFSVPRWVFITISLERIWSFFFFLISWYTLQNLSLSGVATFKCFYFCCFHNWNSVA